MKITKRQLKKIIREEYSRLKRQGLINENYPGLAPPGMAGPSQPQMHSSVRGAPEKGPSKLGGDSLLDFASTLLDHGVDFENLSPWMIDEYGGGWMSDSDKELLNSSDFFMELLEIAEAFQNKRMSRGQAQKQIEDAKEWA